RAVEPAVAARLVRSAVGAAAIAADGVSIVAGLFRVAHAVAALAHRLVDEAVAVVVAAAAHLARRSARRLTAPAHAQPARRARRPAAAAVPDVVRRIDAHAAAAAPAAALPVA